MSTIDVKTAAAVVRALNVACSEPRRLPPASVLRVVALQLGLETVDALATRNSRAFSSLGLPREYVSALWRCYPDKEATDLLRAAIDLFLVRLSARHVPEALKRWGPAAVEFFKNDPYAAFFELKAPLADADAFASSATTAHQRMLQHAKWALRTAKRVHGHTMLATSVVVTRVAASCKLDVGEVRRGLARAVDADDLALLGPPGTEDEALAEPDIVRVEARVAKECLDRVNRSFLHCDVAELEGLDDDQKVAARTVFSSSLSIVTGAPGTGKTTLVRALVRALGEHRCLLTAPTGRAARNVGGSTVHSASGGRLLTRRPIQETSRTDIPDDLALMVVDESSMLTTELMLSVLSLAPPRCHVVLVGDPDQLPPVGIGNVFKDLLASGLVPTGRLTHNHRSCTAVQALARDILDGRVPRDDAVNVVDTVAKGVREVVRLAATSGTPVLVPHNALRHTLNRALQSCRHDVPVRATAGGRQWGLPDGPGVMRTDPATGQATLTFRGGGGDSDKTVVMNCDEALTITTCVHPALPDDAVMVLKNQNKKKLRPGEASACNGDVGTLVRSHPKAIVRLGGDDGDVTEFPCIDGWLTLAYAATVHKFQGSECDEVVLPIYEPAMWDRQLLYTAVTRARNGVTFVGRQSDLAAIVARQRPDRRSVLSMLLVSSSGESV